MTLSIDLGPQLLDVFWPRFVEHDGLILRRRAADPPFLRRIPRDGDRTFTEFNHHVHVFDLFEHDRGVWRPKSGTYDRRHPHFRLAEQLGQAIAQAWFAKLQRDFPRDDFRVYYSRDDNPIVRFHRIYPGEDVLPDPEPGEIEAGISIVWDTRRLARSGRRKSSTRGSRSRAGRKAR